MNYIADAKTKYFDSKEHYLAFRKAWAEYVNANGDTLGGAHFMFYAAIRGRDILEGFRNRTNLKKIYHQMCVNPGAVGAYRELKYWSRYQIASVLRAFGGTIDADTARRVIADMPPVHDEVEYHGSMSFEEWCDYKLALQMKETYENLQANQTPLEPWARKALWEALRESATLISEGEVIK